MSSTSQSKEDKDNLVLEINTAMTCIKHPSILAENELINTGDIANNYFRQRNKGSDFLPPVIRGLSFDYSWVMLERLPELKTISFNEDFHNINLPWLVYVFGFETKYTKLSSMYIYAKNSSIITEDEILYSLNIPGLNEDGHVKDINYTNSNPKVTMDEALRSAIDRFWEGNFATGNYEDNLLMFKEYFNLTLNEVAEKSFEISPISEVISQDYKQRDQDSPPVQTVGEWITFFNTRNDSGFNDWANPMLGFVESIL